MKGNDVCFLTNQKSNSLMQDFKDSGGMSHYGLRDCAPFCKPANISKMEEKDARHWFVTRLCVVSHLVMHVSHNTTTKSSTDSRKPDWYSTVAGDGAVDEGVEGRNASSESQPTHLKGNTGEHFVCGHKKNQLNSSLLCSDFDLHMKTLNSIHMHFSNF